MDIERLILQHKDAVYKQMIRTCGNRDDAEDALADALLAALRAANQIQNPESFRAWLAKIGTRSCARSRIRDRLVQAMSLTELTARGFDVQDDKMPLMDAAEMSALKQCVAGAIEMLPTPYRDVYLRREIDGQRAEQVASELGISLAAVKSRLHRARNIVREALDNGLGCRNLVG